MNNSLKPNHPLVFYGNTAGLNYMNCLSLLSKPEIDRAEKYLLTSDKRNYIVSRSILKQLLSGFLQVNAREIEFKYCKNGKPFLEDYPNLRFNSSHSGEAFVIGFAAGKDIGVDIESLQRPLNISKLQSFLFTPAELRSFNDLNHFQKQQTFINCWTKKEAILKASGEGLTRAMNSFEEPGAEWFIENYSLMDNYCGAIAINGKVDSVLYISINEFDCLFKKPS